MASVTFRFLEPASFFGEIITWRLRERFSHAAIIIGDYAYSSTFPLVAMVPVRHHTVNCEVRKCHDITLEVTDEQLQGIQSWCETQLCKPYDFLSLFGWMFGVHSWRSINATYCFEFCRRPLTFLGLLPANEEHKLITGHRLYGELAALAGVSPQPSFEAGKEVEDLQSCINEDQDEEFWADIALGVHHYCDEHGCYTDAHEQSSERDSTPAL